MQSLQGNSCSQLRCRNDGRMIEIPFGRCSWWGLMPIFPHASATTGRCLLVDQYHMESHDCTGLAKNPHGAWVLSHDWLHYLECSHTITSHMRARSQRFKSYGPMASGWPAHRNTFQPTARMRSPDRGLLSWLGFLAASMPLLNVCVQRWLHMHALNFKGHWWKQQSDIDTHTHTHTHTHCLWTISIKINKPKIAESTDTDWMNNVPPIVSVWSLLGCCLFPVLAAFQISQLVNYNSIQREFYMSNTTKLYKVVNIGISENIGGNILKAYKGEML